MDHSSDTFEPVIGLEIHAQLKTVTKIFSPTACSFAEKPNSQIGPIDTGAPGSLPTLNAEVVRKAVLFGLSVGADIRLFSTFDRKSYFYPDSPRGYQITQFYNPLIEGGVIETDSGSFALHHAHIEDDAGMLKHFSTFAAVDYNRAGNPLIEIVSMPCMRSAKEAVAYAKAVRAILQAINAADCNMEEGGMRFDANISVRRKGESTFRPKVEIKNMNSFANLEYAINAEIKRQSALYIAHPDLPHEKAITPGTYRYDPEQNKTFLMRSKEQAEDYRYFPEPDLPPLVLCPDWVEELKKQIPELPRAKFLRYVQDLGISPFFADLLVQEKEDALYFEKALEKTPHAKQLASWMMVEFPGRLKESGQRLSTTAILPEHLASLVHLTVSAAITGAIAKELADLMVASPGKSPEALLQEHPHLQPLKEEGALVEMIESTIAEHPHSVLDYKKGVEKAFHHLLGQVMKKSKGKADPVIVTRLLTQILAKDG